MKTLKTTETTKVLIVDDDEDDFLIAKSLLREIEKADFEVDWAKNGEMGLDVMSSQNYDVCLLDQHLGAETGLDVLRRLRKRGVRTQVIFLTGQSDPQVDAAAADLGAADFLEKASLSSKKLERAVRYAMSRSRELETLHRMATIDELTNLYNRREFDSRLAAEFERCQRYPMPISLAMIDIDYFKRVNDTYGHATGDRALAWLAQILHNSLRSTDVLARFGGEEFAVVLPGTPLAQAASVAERLRTNVERRSLPRSDEKAELHLTISTGVAEFPTHATDAASLVEAADEALYKAKDQGRNRVVAFENTNRSQP